MARTLTRRVTTNVYIIGGFAAIAGIMFGFDIGSNSGVIGTWQYKQYFNDPDSLLQGGINGALSAGCFVGALIAGFPADRFSRKFTLIGATVLFVIGSLFQACANGVPLLCVGRVLNGLSVGITSMVVPLYQSEVAPKEIRGRIVAVQQWSITWGIMISFWIQYGAQHITSLHNSLYTAAFRIPWGVQATPAVILLMGMWAFPHSPRWLADKGRIEEAHQVLADIHGDGDFDHPRVVTEMNEIQAAIEFDRSIKSHRYADLMQPKYAYRAFLGMFLQVWQQLTGMNIIMFYVVLLFEQAGIGGGDQGAQLISSGVSYVCNVVMTIPAILWVDKWGRRPTMIFGALWMSLFLWIVGGLMSQGDWYLNEDGKWMMILPDSKSKGVVACVYLFVCGFACTWGPIGWIYPAEIYPLRIRAVAVGMSTAANWFFNWLLNFVVPLLMQRIRFGLYMLFAGFNFLMAVHVYLAYPETKGFTLEEMDIVFQYSPRKKLDRAWVEAQVAEKGVQGAQNKEASLSNEKTEDVV